MGIARSFKIEDLDKFKALIESLKDNYDALPEDVKKSLMRLVESKAG